MYSKTVVFITTLLIHIHHSQSLTDDNRGLNVKPSIDRVMEAIQSVSGVSSSKPTESNTYESGTEFNSGSTSTASGSIIPQSGDNGHPTNGETTSELVQGPDPTTTNTYHEMNSCCSCFVEEYCRG